MEIGTAETIAVAFVVALVTCIFVAILVSSLEHSRWTKQ